MKKEEIKQLIENSIPNATAMVMTDDEVHFKTIVIAECFATLSRLERQQRIYDAVQSKLDSGELHALSIKAMTPLEQNGRSSVG